MPGCYKKEGPCAPFFCALVLSVFAGPGLAQGTVERAALKECASLATAGEKLECFESLAKAPGDTASGGEADQNTADTGAAIAVVTTSPQSDGPEEVLTSKVPAATTEPLVETREQVEQTLQPAAPTAPASLGSEHLGRADADEEPESVTATVRDVWKSGNRLLYFQFDNGQVWRQMESGYFSYPRDGEFDVTIRQGVMGDYQLRVHERGRMIRIVRVK